MERLFIFDIANNHSGSMEHAKRIIKDTRKALEGLDAKFAFKFQYRDIDTFIHPDFKDRTDIKYVKRFSETRLSKEQFMELKKLAEELGFITVCTPFDEPSVDLIEEQGYDMLKIASCSFTDWPLLERIAKTDMPIIASTGGATLQEIDNVVMFFLHRKKDLTIMHCIGEYPTKRENLQLNQLELLKKRYPEAKVGYSTHEEPDNVDAVKVAVGKGATVFERHVAVRSEEFPMNAYSSTPEQVRRWVESALDAYAMCGVAQGRHESSEKEQADLRRFKRGAFAKTDLGSGTKLRRPDVFYAFPCSEGQLLANDMSKYMEYTLKTDFNSRDALNLADIDKKNLREKVLAIVRQLKDMLLKSHIALPDTVELELSHHYGIERYEECGAAILNCINREYCKKLIILLPGQKHPVHHHVKKDETFNVLYGDMQVDLDGNEKSLKAGDILTVERNMKHSFCSTGGCIFEEVSTTHFKDDSFYEDDKIVSDRKTRMTFRADWLRGDIR